MKGAILAIMLVLGTCMVMPTGMATNTKTIGNEPIWGKTYTDSCTSGTEIRKSYYFQVHANDNITINTTVANAYSQVWFGGITDVGNPQTVSLPLQPLFFSSASYNISGLAPDAATSGLIDTSEHFWIVSGMDQIMEILVRMYSTTSIQYTINKINATDPITGLQNQINNLTMNLTNLTLNLNELQNYTQWMNKSIRQNLSDEYNDIFNWFLFRLSNLEGQLDMLNTSYQENLTLFQRYMESTNASIELLQDAWSSSIRQELDDMNNMTRNMTLIRDEINIIKQPINATYLNQTLVNQTVVNQTVVNKTEVQPVTYINKTIENQAKIDYLTSAIVGIIGGLISGGIIATVLVGRRKPEIIHMRNVEPPEDLKEKMMNVRKLQSQDAEGEVSPEENEKGK
jgi:hypothetical protein